MFGMGFTEILIIAVIAILFLGPDKLPETMVEIAKFFRSVKKTVSSAKASLDEELHISDMKEEVMNYKKELTSASGDLERMVNTQEINSELHAVKKSIDDAGETEASTPKPAAPSEPEVVTFPKKKKAASDDASDIASS
jgi:sec-independent protein translocase protein TatB